LIRLCKKHLIFVFTSCYKRSMGKNLSKLSLEQLPLQRLTLDERQELGYDIDSIVADQVFVDPENGDYRVKHVSPTLELGFKNFDMSWGLTDEFPRRWRNK